MKEPIALIKSAVDQIVYEINKNKKSPHEATVKVAKQLDLNINFIKRASEALNVALTYNHFKKNPNNKEAEFPIVDAAKVAEEIYGKTQKTAEELKAEWFPNISFDAEQIDYGRILTDPQYKTAYIKLANEGDNTTEFQMSFKGVFEKCANYISRLEKEAEELHFKQLGLNQDYSVKFASLVEKFKRTPEYRTKFAEFETQVYSIYGEPVLQFVDHIYKAAELNEDRGVHDVKYQLFDTCKEAEMFQDFITSVDTFKTITKQAEEAEIKLKAEKDYLTQAYHKIGANRTEEPKQEPVLEMPKKAECAPMVDPVKDAVNKKIAHVSEVEKKAALQLEPLDEAGLTDAQKGLPHPLKAAIIRSKKKYASLDPRIKEAFDLTKTLLDSHKAFKDHVQSQTSPSSNIPSTKPEDNLDRQLLVQELMASDPILSQADPHRVVELYQQLLRLSPEIAKEKEIVRGTLRQMYSAQALSPHDGQQYINTNKDLVELKQLQNNFGAKKTYGKTASI